LTRRKKEYPRVPSWKEKTLTTHLAVYSSKVPIYIKKMWIFYKATILLCLVFPIILANTIYEDMGCGSGLEVGCKIALQSYHGKFVVAETNGDANANSEIMGPGEIFTAKFLRDNLVTFKGAHGKFLVAEPNGKVNANREVSSIWETFEVIKKGNGFAFKSFHGKWLVAEPNGALNANRPAASDWETFKVFAI